MSAPEVDRFARPWPAMAVVAILVAVAGCSGNPGEGSEGSVLLVILDTVRADHLGVDGYHRDTTPNLDILAGEGEYYRNAWSQAPWTLPGIATILTGQPPHVHGAGRHEGELYPLQDRVLTLAEMLRKRGYRTGAVFSVVFCSPKSGLGRGFDKYDFKSSDASNVGQRRAEEVTDAALRWVRRETGRPFLLVVHYFDAHLTYDPPPPYDTMFEPDGRAMIPEGFGSASQVLGMRSGAIELSPRQRISLMARYDGEIRYVDDQIGRLRAGLENAGLWDDTLVVVAGDHGEEFWDHGGFEHGHTHHGELMRVPLIVKRPGGPGGVEDHSLARQMDIFPTIIDFLGEIIPEELPGVPLGSGKARFSIAEGSYWAGELRSIRSDGGTLLTDETGTPAAFFLPGDPLEKDNAIGSNAAVELELSAILESLPEIDRTADRRWALGEEQIRQLKALGYLD